MQSSAPPSPLTADRAAQPAWVAVHAVCWTLLIFGATELVRAVSSATSAPDLARGLLLYVLLLLSLVLVVAGLGVVDGLFFRRGRLLRVWVITLVAEALLTTAATLYRVVTGTDLQSRTAAQVAASVAPGLLLSAAFTLVVLGAAAAAGVGVGTVVARRRRSSVLAGP